jgi:hypothetical protein
MPGARCTRGLVCKMCKRKRTRAYRFSGGNPAFPARWFYSLFRALPGDRAFLPPSSLRSLLLKNLTPASGRQDHTTSPSAPGAARLAPPKRPPHPAPNVRDDGQRPSARGGTAQLIILFLPIGEAKYFLPRGWTRCLSGTRLICPSGKIKCAYSRRRRGAQQGINVARAIGGA